MAGLENVNLALDSHGASAYSGIATGAKAGQRKDHTWWGVEAVLENAGNPDYVSFFDDFLGDTLNGTWQPTVSNSGTVVVNAQNGGAVRVLTDTGAADLASLALGLHWLVSGGYTILRARVQQVTAITERIVEIGLNDAIAPAGGLAFSAPNTPTAVATNAAIFGFAAATMTTYSALAVNAGGTPQKVLAVATPGITWQHFMIVIDALGNAYYYTGSPPTLVASIPLAVATTAVLTPWVAIKNQVAAAHGTDVDYLSIQGARV